MCKEQPWVLKKEKTAVVKHKNAMQNARCYFASNTNKVLTARELESILGYQKAMISIVLKSLLNSREIKIVGFTGNSSLTPLYQSIKGKGEEVKFIDLHEGDEVYCSLSTFIKKCNIPSSYYFRTLVEQSNIPYFYAKNPFSIVYYFEDLKELLKETYKIKKKEWKISFKIFGFEVIIKAPN